MAVVFDPDDSKTLVTCGKEHVYFWRLHNTRLERKSGYFEVNLSVLIQHEPCIVNARFLLALNSKTDLNKSVI